MLRHTQRFWSSNFLQEGEYALAGGMSTAGSLTTWFKDQVAQAETAAERAGGQNAYAALAEAASASPVGARGLVTLPYFEGERTPLHDPKARGLWFGLSLKHTRADIYRAVLEGVAYGIRHNLEVMAEEGMHPRRILVSGGGAQNRLWLQIVADVCGIDLTLPDQLAGASFGDAFLASVGSGLHKNLADIERWVHRQAVISYNPQNHASYQAFYRIYRELYSQTQALMHQLSDLAGEKNDDKPMDN